MDKANVVADVLSPEAVGMGSLAYLQERPMTLDIQFLANQMVRLDISEPSRVFASVEARSSLIEYIRAQQCDDPQLRVIWDKVLSGEARKETLDSEGILRIEGRIIVPKVESVAILDRQVRQLQSKKIPSLKVQWRHHLFEKAACERDLDMQTRYPHLFEPSGFAFVLL
ncbi:uncharacterized protein LOC125873932 [Solanum stenotomum]|uniref:uncharacterized protein LOC125873932 n=1 Tax=Solanum stenotomum TaxID=172797 RepID=UPI0020D0AB74|nr:uncharacterized protein LOC125873932 [Solanum stenotomum]